MKRPRPYIPLSVRQRVIHGMLARKIDWSLSQQKSALDVWKSLGSDHARIEIGLSLLGLEGAHLDHDPALILRKFNPRTGKYTPDANDPAFLIYREKADHQQKTTGRKPGAERTVTTKGSDIWLKSKFNRLEGRTKQRPKQKIQSRGFQKRKPSVDKVR